MARHGVEQLGYGQSRRGDRGGLALAVVANGDLYAGGYFTQAGGAAANNVARWDGTAWSSLGTGTREVVCALASGPTGKLYVGGAFSTTGDGSRVMAHFGIYDPNALLAIKAATAARLFSNPAHGTATLRLPAGTPRLPFTLTDALRCAFPAPGSGVGAGLAPARR